MNKAIEALKKRVPGYAAEFYHEQFQFHLALLVATIDAVQEAMIQLKPADQHNHYADVDQEHVIHKLHTMLPDQAED